MRAGGNLGKNPTNKKMSNSLNEARMSSLSDKLDSQEEKKQAEKAKKEAKKKKK